MRNILACIAAGVLILAGVGWYLGWFRVQTAPAPDGHREVKIDVDGNKVKADLNKGEQSIEKLIHQGKDGKPQSVSPGSSSSLSVPPTGTRFRVENGVLVDTTGEVSAPVPIK